MKEEDPKCELCGDQFNDPTYTQEELNAEFECIKENGRCLGCYEEYGETGYPDR